jgi:transcriptional regulator with XRE-family HTH domain
MHKPEEPFVSPLRLIRGTSTFKSREDVAIESRRLAEANPDSYCKISSSYLQKLESDLAIPREKTALTLAAIFQREISELFPKGWRTESNNPLGRGAQPKK